MCSFDMFLLSISVLGQLLVIGLIISDSYNHNNGVGGGGGGLDLLI